MTTSDSVHPVQHPSDSVLVLCLLSFALPEKVSGAPFNGAPPFGILLAHAVAARAHG